MSIITTILATPVTSQMEHTAGLTSLYWLLLPVVACFAGLGALWGAIKRAHHKHTYRPTRFEVEARRLKGWRDYEARGISPVPGKPLKEAIEDQENLCRELWALQSGLHSDSSEGGRSTTTNSNTKGR